MAGDAPLVHREAGLFVFPLHPGGVQDVISDVLGRVCVIKVNNLLLQHMSNNPSDIKVGWSLAQIAHIPRKNPTLPARARVRGRLVVSAIKPHEISTLPGPGRVSRFRSVCGCSAHPCISAEHQHSADECTLGSPYFEVCTVHHCCCCCCCWPRRSALWDAWKQQMRQETLSAIFD